MSTGQDPSQPGTRYACETNFVYSGNGASGGTSTNGEQYCNVGGVAPGSPTTGLSGTYSSIDASGRFTETLGTAHRVTYMASTGRAMVLSTDSNPVLAGRQFQQTGGPYGQGSLNGNVVIYANGVNNSTSGKMHFGLFSADGVSTFTVNADYENDGGTWTKNPGTGSCTYTVAANGGVSGCGGELYLTAPNTGVSVGNDAGGFAGFITPQTGRGGFTTAGRAGTFFGGTTEVINQASEAEGDLVTLSGVRKCLGY